MTFKFGFSDPAPETVSHAVQETVPCEKQSLDILRKTAPRISYTCFPTADVNLPRRDLFDVRYELMQQDNLSEEDKILLGTEDVRKTVYEGGLKVWEGAGDLITVLAKNGPNAHNVLELGCGAAVPICYLIYRAIKMNQQARFVLSDYNTSVLRLLSMPNVVLAWLAATDKLPSSPDGEINITSDLLDDFEADMARRGITLEFISGGWSDKFVQLLGRQFELVLASETIYSLDSLNAFTDTFVAALGPSSVGLVAAKKMYFGVGGGIVEFERMLDARKIKHEVTHTEGNVGRVVLEATRR